MFRKEFLTVSLSSAHTKEDQSRHEFYFVGLENIFTISRSTVSCNDHRDTFFEALHFGIWRGLHDEPSSNLLQIARYWSFSLLIVSRPIFSFGPKLDSKLAELSLQWWILIYSFNISFSTNMYALDFMASPIRVAAYPCSLFGGFIDNFLTCVLFDCTTVGVDSKALTN